ncbi:hypothetical protein [Nocardiopsis sp. FR26]|uniref:hypothetical protein n=1 Tax=Nocardiopsis sp. FR26 TaxID=2605987 RepID=UPI00135BAA25|nr:hypothetical protein [Nocardiopsis sp. FR26]
MQRRNAFFWRRPPRKRKEGSNSGTKRVPRIVYQLGIRVLATIIAGLCLEMLGVLGWLEWLAAWAWPAWITAPQGVSTAMRGILGEG